MSRVPFDAQNLDREPPLVDPGPPGTVASATARLALLAGLSWLILPLAFLPAATTRWLRAIRGVEGPAPRGGSAAVLFLVTAYTPIVAWLGALGLDDTPRLSSGLAALGVSLALVPPLLRAPLLLVGDRPEERGWIDLSEPKEPLTVAEGLRRSLLSAAAAPLQTLVLTIAHLAITLVALGLARFAPTLHGVAVVVGLLLVLVLPPVLWTPMMSLASRWTPAHAPVPTVRSLGALALQLLPPLVAIATIAMLATKDPLPLEVVVEGRGVQPVRGLMREGGDRGALDEPGFTLRPGRWSDPWSGQTLVVDPDDGGPYPIAAEYDTALALMVAHPSGDGSVAVTLEGPDWTLRVRLDEHGHRLDDGLVDRALERVGAAGVVAFVVGTSVVLLAWLLLARVGRRARRLGGAGFRHRLPGRLRLGERGGLEGGALLGSGNRVELLDGSVTLRLPERIVPVGVDPVASQSLEAMEVVVSMNEPLPIATHRSADAPWPVDAALLLGSPAAIESASLTGASRTIALLALAAAVTSALSLLVLALR